jgi:flagellar hook-associated protein 3 FlgL
MKISTAQFYNNASRQMIESQQRLSGVQAELATGKKILSASDAPDKISAIQRVGSLLSQQDIHQNNLESVNQRLQTQETALRSSSNLLIRLRELATQFANSTYTPTQRNSAATEVQGIRDQLLGLANAKDANGKSVFAGSLTGQNAFSAGGVYQGNQANLEVEVGESYQLQTPRSGSDVFTSVIRQQGSQPAQAIGFFQALDDFTNALNNSDLDAIRLSISETDQLHQGVTTALADIGVRLKDAQEQGDLLNEQNLRLKTLQSELQDVDYAEAITRMQKEMMGLQAAQSSFAQISRLSLFNYMN